MSKSDPMSEMAENIGRSGDILLGTGETHRELLIRKLDEIRNELRIPHGYGRCGKCHRLIRTGFPLFGIHACG